VIQTALLVAIALALQNPLKHYNSAVNCNCLLTTQDIAADAYRADVLEELEMGAGAAVFVLGYRIALCSPVLWR